MTSSQPSRLRSHGSERYGQYEEDPYNQYDYYRGKLWCLVPSFVGHTGEGNFSNIFARMSLIGLLVLLTHNLQS